MSTTTNSNVSTRQANVTPFVYFYGRCQEALEFYVSVFGGRYQVMQRNADSPFADQLPAEFRDKISAATFTADGVTLMASDGGGPKPLDPDAGNISLALSMPDAAAGERVFNALAEGGHVKVPFENASWGGHLGVVHDRFATEWIVTSG